MPLTPVVNCPAGTTARVLGSLAITWVGPAQITSAGHALASLVGALLAPPVGQPVDMAVVVARARVIHGFHSNIGSGGLHGTQLLTSMTINGIRAKAPILH